MIEMKITARLLAFCTSLLFCQNSYADIPGALLTPPVISSNAPLRTNFISYDIREQAENADTEKNQHFHRLTFPVPFPVAEGDNNMMTMLDIDIPYMWLDRDVFLRIEEVPYCWLYINNRKAGTGIDSKAGTEFNISPYITDGINTIRINIPAYGKQIEKAGTYTDSPVVTLYSQPRVRIEDYTVKLTPDASGKHGIFEVLLALSNSYNPQEKITVGYDIYSPAGKLQYYDMKQISVRGLGRDTVSFIEPIYDISQFAWDASNPGLFYGMLTVSRAGRMTEYIPYRIGLGTTDIRDGVIYRNGQPINISAARYNSASTEELTTRQLKKLKEAGINTLCPDYPQPMWLYGLCDQLGIYVIDRANIHSDPMGGNRNVDGALSNNPRWMEGFLQRNASMFQRAKNHVCIIGWSIGGDTGNGYNMQESYLLMKSLEAGRAEVIPDKRTSYERPPIVNEATATGTRAVVFQDARGEWNTDIREIPLRDAAAILN